MENKKRDPYVPSGGERFRVVENHPTEGYSQLKVGDVFEAGKEAGCWESNEEGWIVVKRSGSVNLCRVAFDPNPGDMCDGMTTRGDERRGAFLRFGNESMPEFAMLEYRNDHGPIGVFVYRDTLRPGSTVTKQAGAESAPPTEPESFKRGERVEWRRLIHDELCSWEDRPDIGRGVYAGIEKCLHQIIWDEMPDRTGSLCPRTGATLRHERSTLDKFGKRPERTIDAEPEEASPAVQGPKPKLYVPKPGEWVKIAGLAPEPPKGVMRSVRVGDIVKTDFAYAIAGGWLMLLTMGAYRERESDWCRVTPADELDVLFTMRQAEARFAELSKRYRTETRGKHDWEPPEDFEVSR